MKNMRIPLIIAWAIAVIGIVLGSFFDLSISQAIASPSNGFALTVSAIGPMIGFGAVACMGGGFIALIVKGQYHIALKILFGVLAAACLGVAIKYPAGEWFGVNGFYGAAPEWVGYLIVIIPECAAMLGGYFLFKDCQNKNIWIVFCVIIGLLLIALVAVIPTIKDNLHRPRYRLISAVDTIEFHSWWQPFKEYDYYKGLYDSDKVTYAIYSHDNFKSCPSGHTAEASILLVAVTFLPLAHDKFKKWQMPLFYGSCGLVLLVALARILAAAHFLSDVSWGATIMLTLVIIANEVVMRVKPLQLNQEVPQEQKD